MGVGPQRPWCGRACVAGSGTPGVNTTLTSPALSTRPPGENSLRCRVTTLAAGQGVCGFHFSSTTRAPASLEPVDWWRHTVLWAEQTLRCCETQQRLNDARRRRRRRRKPQLRQHAPSVLTGRRTSLNCSSASPSLKPTPGTETASLEGQPVSLLSSPITPITPTPPPQQKQRGTDRGLQTSSFDVRSSTRKSSANQLLCTPPNSPPRCPAAPVATERRCRPTDPHTPDCVYDAVATQHTPYLHLHQRSRPTRTHCLAQ